MRANFERELGRRVDAVIRSHPELRVLWLHGLVIWIENEPVLDEEAQAEIQAAMRRLAPPEEAG
jgi:hypothetical protein